MAVTGIVLSLFVLGHMAGNLQAFLPNGPEALDHYGAFLRELLHGTGIWFVRAGSSSRSASTSGRT
jgi:succinate dehydrogenase / fumarate reductase cytochrome b subunit